MESIDPNKQDVLFGRGVAIQSWPGNRAYLERIKVDSERYRIADCKEKGMIAHGVMKFIQKERGGKFLKPHKRTSTNTPDSWYEAPDSEVWKKVTQAMRSMNRKVAKTTQAPSSFFTERQSPLVEAVSSCEYPLLNLPRDAHNISRGNFPLVAFRGYNDSSISLLSSRGTFMPQFPRDAFVPHTNDGIAHHGPNCLDADRPTIVSQRIVSDAGVRSANAMTSNAAPFTTSDINETRRFITRTPPPPYLVPPPQDLLDEELMLRARLNMIEEARTAAALANLRRFM